MSRYTWPIIVAACASVVGILTDAPLVIAFCTLAACGMTLLALLDYFATVR